MTPLLTIQIPYTEERKGDCERLLFEFEKQIMDNNLKGVVELQSDGTGKEMSIGEKRGLLYQKSNGIYTTQWDSDDWIMPNGIALIVEAAKMGSCCVTYEESINMDGRYYRGNHSLQYSGWYGDGSHLLFDGFHYHRSPYMKSVIKTEIAKSIPVPHIRFGEDCAWSEALLPHLKTESHIPKEIYLYIKISTDHTTRYGFDKDKTQ